MFLMNKFHELCRVLFDAKGQLDAGQLPPAQLHERLVSLLNRQESEAVHELGHYGLDVFRRAKYAMAALADEIILGNDPANGEWWMPYLLESALFRSQRAGEKVFDDIDEMQTLGSAAGELARVYLAVLGLGFQGMYRGIRDGKTSPEQHLAPYRQKLFRLAYGHDPVVTTGRAPINAAAYASTLTDGERGQLPHLKPWIWSLVLIVLLYFAGGAKIWVDVTRDLDLDKVRNFHPQRTR